MAQDRGSVISSTFCFVIGVLNRMLFATMNRGLLFKFLNEVQEKWMSFVSLIFYLKMTYLFFSKKVLDHLYYLCSLLI